MEFIKNLYDSEYFLYVLLGIIAVLIILFLVVLFSGKKKNKEEVVTETAPVNNIESINLGQVTPNQQPAAAVTSGLDETKEFSPEMMTSYQNNEFLSTNTPIVNNMENVVPPMNETPVIEKPIIPTPEPVSEVVIPEPVVDVVSEIPVTPTPEPVFNPFPETENTAKMPNPNQFSSVFIDNGNPGMNMNQSDFVESVPEVEPTSVATPPIEEPPAFAVINDELPKLNDDNKEL